LLQKEQKIVTTATDVKELADIFNQVHAIEANANILAVIAANLANNGTHIQSKASLASSQAVQETLSNMSACGLNNDSKDWYDFFTKNYQKRN
jgi:glutaminase